MPHLDRLARLDAAARAAFSLGLSLLVVTAFLTWAGVASARTWYVKVDGTGDAPTIRAAVDSSTAGDTVLVAPGTYEISSAAYVKPETVLISEQGPVVTRLMPRAIDPFAPSIVCRDFWSASTVVSGFWFEGFNWGFADDAAVEIIDAYGVVIEGNVFVHNERAAIAMYQISGANVTIQNNTIVSDATYAFIGGSVPGFIRNNIIWGRAVGMGRWTMFNCMKYVADAGSQAPFNFDDDPQFCGAPGSDNYYIQSDSPCVDAFSEGLVGALPVGCGTVRVEPTSWGRIKAIYK
jgi:hypothetical protein